MEYKLYRWQEECLSKWEENNHQGIVNVVTGGGKTVLALSAIKKVFDENLRIKIIVPTVNLLYQWKKEIIKTFGKTYENKISLIFANSRINKNAIFSIYVVNSARHKISKAIIDDMNRGFKVMLIADEAHHYLSNENRKVFHYLLASEFDKSRFYSLGLSATIDEKGLNDILIPALGKVIYTLKHNEALSDNIISPFAIFETSINFKPKEEEEYIRISDKIEKLRRVVFKKYPYLKLAEGMNDYIKALRDIAKEDEEVDIYVKLLLKRRKISLTSKTRIDCGVEVIKNLCDKKIIVFAERITQIKEFETRLINEGINNVSCYHSKQAIEYRKRILQDFKDGAINILLTCKALDEGVDVPDAEVAIVLSSTSLPRQRIQRLGGILRKNNNKNMASLFYLYVNEANDDALYLRDLYQKENRIMNLRYYDTDKSFSNIQYEDHIIQYYKSLNSIKNKELLAEYNRCLEKGMLRTDWLLSKDELDEIIKNSKTNVLKNYYKVMKKICVNQ